MSAGRTGAPWSADGMPGSLAGTADAGRQDVRAARATERAAPGRRGCQSLAAGALAEARPEARPEASTVSPTTIVDSWRRVAGFSRPFVSTGTSECFLPGRVARSPDASTDAPLLTTCDS